ICAQGSGQVRGLGFVLGTTPAVRPTSPPRLRNEYPTLSMPSGIATSAGRTLRMASPGRSPPLIAIGPRPKSRPPRRNRKKRTNLAAPSPGRIVRNCAISAHGGFLTRWPGESNPQPPDRQPGTVADESPEIPGESASPAVRLHSSCTELAESAPGQPPSGLVAALLALLNQLSPADREALARVLTTRHTAEGHA